MVVSAALFDAHYVGNRLRCSSVWLPAIGNRRVIDTGPNLSLDKRREGCEPCGLRIAGIRGVGGGGLSAAEL